MAEEEKKTQTAEPSPADEEIKETKEAAEKAEAPEERKETREGESAEAGAEEKQTEEAGQKEKTKPDPKDLKIEELTDKYKRLFAEFDNFRKRTDAEKSGMYAEGQRNVLEKILPVIDNFERALENVPEELKGSSYVEGVEKIYRSCMDTLKALGVEPIETVGKPFDANLHNAVMHVEDEDHGENEVVEEFQRGYTFKDKVLRYSMVKVAN